MPVYEEGYYTLKDVEDYFGLDRVTLRNWAHRGLLRAQKRQVSGVTMKVWTITATQFNETIPQMIREHWSALHFKTRHKIYEKFPLILDKDQMQSHQAEAAHKGVDSGTKPGNEADGEV